MSRGFLAAWRLRAAAAASAARRSASSYRCEELGEEGLGDRSSRPHRSPRATCSGVVAEIVYLRRHCCFGPLEIAVCLKRYHDIEMSESGVWRVLDRRGMGRLPASQRCKRRKQRPERCEKPQPGHQVQIDVKSIAPIPGAAAKKHCQFTAIDDCTRIRVLRVYPKNNQKAAIQFLDYVLERLPLRVESVQTDNGAEFQTGFCWHVLDRGIRHTCIKPAAPRLNGKVERSHRTGQEELHRMPDGIAIDDTDLFNDKPQQWEDYYNFDRPQGALDGQTPNERLKQKTNRP